MALLPLAVESSNRDSAFPVFLKKQSERHRRIKTIFKTMSSGLQWTASLRSPNGEKNHWLGTSERIKEMGAPLVAYSFFSSARKFFHHWTQLGGRLRKKITIEKEKEDSSIHKAAKDAFLSSLNFTGKGISFIEWLSKVHLISLYKEDSMVPKALVGVHCTTDALLTGAEIVRTVCHMYDATDKKSSCAKHQVLKEQKKILLLKLGKCLLAAVLTVCAVMSFFFKLWVPPLMLLSLSTTMLVIGLIKYFANKRQQQINSPHHLMRQVVKDC